MSDIKDTTDDFDELNDELEDSIEIAKELSNIDIDVDDSALDVTSKKLDGINNTEVSIKVDTSTVDNDFDEIVLEKEATVNVSVDTSSIDSAIDEEFEKKLKDLSNTISITNDNVNRSHSLSNSGDYFSALVGHEKYKEGIIANKKDPSLSVALNGGKAEAAYSNSVKNARPATDEDAKRLSMLEYEYNSIKEALKGKIAFLEGQFTDLQFRPQEEQEKVLGLLRTINDIAGKAEVRASSLNDLYKMINAKGSDIEVSSDFDNQIVKAAEDLQVFYNALSGTNNNRLGRSADSLKERLKEDTTENRKEEKLKSAIDKLKSNHSEARKIVNEIMNSDATIQDKEYSLRNNDAINALVDSSSIAGSVEGTKDSAQQYKIKSLIDSATKKLKESNIDNKDANVSSDLAEKLKEVEAMKPETITEESINEYQNKTKEAFSSMSGESNVDNAAIDSAKKTVSDCVTDMITRVVSSKIEELKKDIHSVYKAGSFKDQLDKIGEIKNSENYKYVTANIDNARGLKGTFNDGVESPLTTKSSDLTRRLNALNMPLERESVKDKILKGSINTKLTNIDSEYKEGIANASSYKDKINAVNEALDKLSKVKPIRVSDESTLLTRTSKYNQDLAKYNKEGESAESQELQNKINKAKTEYLNKVSKSTNDISAQSKALEEYSAEVDKIKAELPSNLSGTKSDKILTDTYLDISRSKESLGKKIDSKTKADNYNEINSKMNEIRRLAIDKTGNNSKQIIQLANELLKSGKIESGSNQELELNRFISNNDSGTLGNRLARTKSRFDIASESSDVSMMTKLSDLYTSLANKIPDVTQKTKALAEAKRLASRATAAQFNNDKLEAEAMAFNSKGTIEDSRDIINFWKSKADNYNQGSKEYIQCINNAKKEENAAKANFAKGDNIVSKIYGIIDNPSESVASKVSSIMKMVTTNISNGVNKIVGIIRAGVTMIHKIIQGATMVVRSVRSILSRIITLFGSLANRVRTFATSARNASNGTDKLGGSMNVLKGTATELNSKLELIKKAFNALFNNQMLESAIKLDSTLTSIKSLLGNDSADAINKWAFDLERAFGVSATETISGLQEITSLLYGIGVNKKYVASASTDLYSMAQYFSALGFAGGDVNEVISKLSSGIKGMTQSVDDLGISVKQSQMNQFLKDLKAQGGEYANIGTSVKTLTEEQLTYVRLASMESQFTKNFDIKGYTGLMDNTYFRISLIKSQIASIATLLGKVIEAVIAKLLPVIMTVIYHVKDGVTSLAKFFGVNIDSGKNAKSIDEMTNAFGKNAKAAKEAKKESDKWTGTAGFDKITSLDSSSSSSSSTSDFDYSKLLTNVGSISSKLQELAKGKNYKSMVEKQFSSLLNKLNSKFHKWANNITGYKVNLGFNSDKAKKDLSKIGRNIKDTFRNIIDTWSWINIRIADDINIGKVVNDVLSIARAFTRCSSVITKTLEPVIKNLYDNYLSKYVKMAGNAIDNILDRFEKRINKFTKGIRDFNKVLELMFNNRTSDSKLDNKIDNLSKDHPTMAKAAKGVKAIRDNGAGGLRAMFSNNPTKDDQASLTNLEKQLPLLTRVVEVLGNVSKILGTIKSKYVEPLITYLSENLPKPVEILDSVNKILTKINKALNNNSDKVIGDTAVNFSLLGTVINGLGSIIGPLINTLGILYQEVIIPLLGKLDEFMKSEFFPWLQEKIKALGNWIKAHSDEIVNFVTTISSELWNMFITIEPYLEKVATWIIKNPDLIIGFLKGLVALKIGSWAASQVAGIVSLIAKIKDLKNISKLGELAESLGSTSTVAEVGATGAAGATGATEAGVAGAAGTAASGGAAAAGMAVAGQIIAGISAVIAAWNLGKFIGNHIVPEKMKQYMYKWKLKDLLNYNPLEWLDGLHDWIVDAVLPKKLKKLLGKWKLFDLLNVKPSEWFNQLKDWLTGTLDKLKKKFSGFFNFLFNGDNTTSNGVTKTTTTTSPSNGSAISVNSKNPFVQATSNNWVSTSDIVAKARKEAEEGLKKKNKVKKLKYHAVGGSENPGSLFIANEDGSATELIGNITGRSKTDVANNGMIIKAMETAIYNSMVDAMNQRSYESNNKQNTSTNINISGFGLIDKTTLRKFASILAPYIDASKADLVV